MEEITGQKDQKRGAKERGIAPRLDPGAAAKPNVGEEEKNPRKPRMSLKEIFREVRDCAVAAAAVAALFAMWESNRMTRESNRLTREALDFAIKSEAPVISLYNASATPEGNGLRLWVEVRNTGRSPARIRQARCLIASESAAWGVQQEPIAPDSLVLGPGDTHVFKYPLGWPDASTKRRDLGTGIRAYIVIDFVHANGTLEQSVICQHYSAVDGLGECKNAGPD